MAWDPTTPAGTDLIKDGDDILRELKLAIKSALQNYNSALAQYAGNFPGGAEPTTNPTYDYRGLRGTTAQKPASGQFGFYFDTTRGVMCRDNGSTWDDVATLGSKVIPAGSKTVWYQAAAPVGWTRDTSSDDKFIRVVSAGSPGSVGGSYSLGSEAAHTHDIPGLGHKSGDYLGIENGAVVHGAAMGTVVRQLFSGGNDTGYSKLRAGAGTSHTHTHTSAEHAYMDCLVASKDAY